jgi:ABC-type molybdate transport system substrate-binding protein
MRHRAGALAILLLLAGAGCAAERSPLRVVAGSGIVGVVDETVMRYRAEHPDRPIAVAMAGDVELVERVASGDLAADVLLVSDAALLGALQQSGWTSFQIRFAADRMVLALGGDVDPAGRDWSELLLDPGVAIAAADPERSSLGYRFDFVLRLQDRVLPEAAIADAVIARADGAGRVADAVLLTESVRAGPVDAALLYASIARSAGLVIVELPAGVDLGSEHLAPVYAPVTLPVPGGGEARRAAPIQHAVTIADETPSRAEAIDFLRLLLDAEARARMAERGLTPVTGPDRVLSFGVPTDVERLLESTAR